MNLKKEVGITAKVRKQVASHAALPAGFISGFWPRGAKQGVMGYQWGKVVDPCESEYVFDKL